MTIRLKTVEFTHPVTAAAVNNTLTTATQITIYLPETGTKTFRSVVATLSAMQTSTATGNLTSRNLQCRLGAAAYTANSQAVAMTTSGEDLHLQHAVDLTAHFTTNWTGASMTFDSQFQLNGAGTGAAWTGVCVTISITYEYDDTSTTQIKTVRIPLNAPVGLMSITKPGAAIDTIPNLTTYLPETSKIFRSIYTVIQGNIQQNAATADLTITQQIDATVAHTSGAFEGVSASDYWFRYVWDCSAVLVTNATNGWYIYASVAKVNHIQAWLVVTYEFDSTATTDCFVSLILPQEITSPFGGTTSADYQRATRELRIPEGTISGKNIAAYVHWDQMAAIAGLNMRVGTGAFVTYTDNGAVMAGGNGAMIRNDAAFTLVQGLNNLQLDVYRTGTADFGVACSAWWIINYTCAKPSAGYGAASHTVLYNLAMTFDGALAGQRTTAAIAPSIPETDYYIQGLGAKYENLCSGTVTPAGQSVVVERLAAEGGVQWEAANIDFSATDPEIGIRTSYCQIKDNFLRFPGDKGPNRMDLETARRWRVTLGTGGTAMTTGWHRLDMIITYHTIIPTISGTISGSSGGTVTINLHRKSTGELLKQTTRVGNGTYSFTWYDPTDVMFVEARESGTLIGRSEDGVAA
jgi:hypothetical protein